MAGVTDNNETKSNQFINKLNTYKAPHGDFSERMRLWVFLFGQSVNRVTAADAPKPCAPAPFSGNALRDSTGDTRRITILTKTLRETSKYFPAYSFFAPRCCERGFFCLFIFYAFKVNNGRV